MRFFLSDHLGSVVAVVNASGGLVSRQGYYPYGGVRSDVGTITTTDFGYTGQRNLDAQGNSYRLGLMDIVDFFSTIWQFIEGLLSGL